MEAKVTMWVVMMLVLSPVFSSAWRDDRRESLEPRELRRPGVHYHTKRHMMIAEPEQKKRPEKTSPRPMREIRKKPTGHLTPLQEDEMENDEVVSVAIGPPPARPKFDKHRKIPIMKPMTKVTPPNSTAIGLVREVLSQIGREFLTKDLNENFVFGQYVGSSMKNLTNSLRLRMQHDILDLIIKYQRLNNNGTKIENPEDINGTKVEKLEKILEKKTATNETEESWPDFTNLAKIVG